MKLSLFCLSILFTLSACVENKDDMSNEGSNFLQPTEQKVDRDYINDLYGPKHDPIKNWSDGMKSEADRKNGKGC